MSCLLLRALVGAPFWCKCFCIKMSLVSFTTIINREKRNVSAPPFVHTGYCIIKLFRHGFFRMYVIWLLQLHSIKHRGSGVGGWNSDIGDPNSCIKRLSLHALCAPWKDHDGPEEPPAVSLKYWAAQKCACWNPACLPCCWMALLCLAPSQFNSSLIVHSASVQAKWKCQVKCECQVKMMKLTLKSITCYSLLCISHISSNNSASSFMTNLSFNTHTHLTHAPS